MQMKKWKERKKGNIVGEESKNVIWQCQGKEEERQEPVPQPPSEEGSNMTQIDTKELEKQTIEERLI